MSGHGGFSVIGSGMKLPHPVEQPKVTELKLGGDSLGALNVEGVKPATKAEDMRLEQTNRIVAKLDALLLKAAKSASAPADAQALKGVAEGAGLDKATRKAIESVAKKAQSTFRTINGFTGRQIAAALVKDENGVFDWDLTNPAGKAIKAALDAQADLSELLAKTLNALPPNATARVHIAFEEAMLQTDRRASELQTLVCDFADMAEKAGDDPAIAARLDRTLESLIPSQSLKMHGSEKVAADFRVAMMPLAKRIDDLAAAKERSLSGNEATKIRRQIDEAFNALTLAERAHAEKGIPLDHSLFDSARGLLTDLTKRLADIRREVTLGSLRNFIDKTFTPPDIPILQGKFRPFVKKLFPSLVAAIDTQKMLRDAALDFLSKRDDKSAAKMESLARALASLSSGIEADLKKITTREYNDHLMYNLSFQQHPDVQELIDSLPRKERAACTPTLVAEFCDTMQMFLDDDHYPSNLAALTSMYGGVSGVATQTAHLVQMYRNAGGTDPSQFLTNKTLAAAFEGKMAVTTLVETRIAGLPDADADPALDDANVVSSKPLGSGKVNTVHQIDFKDGTTRIFKPEAPGRQGLERLALSDGSYEDTLLVAQLNMASQRTAEAFGLEDVMTKTSVGTHDGQFGMYMEKAPGREAADFVSDSQKAIPGGLTAKEIRELPDEQYGQVVGDIMRKSNRLEWFDILTGQADRHHHNYMLNVTKDCTVTHKGIDNDGCFGTFIAGPGVFVLTGVHAKNFMGHLGLVSKHLYPRWVERSQSHRLTHDPGIRRRDDGAVVVDTTKTKCPEVHYCLQYATGCHVTRAPEFIDKELYDRLIAMKGGAAREKYIADLAARLAPSQVQFAVARLDAAIRHAEALNGKGRVIATDEWGRQDLQRIVAGKPPPPMPTVGGNAPAKTEFAKRVENEVCVHQVSLFRRDLLKHIAKPGWFEV